MKKEQFLKQLNASFQKNLHQSRLQMIFNDVTADDVEFLKKMNFIDITYEKSVLKTHDSHCDYVEYTLLYEIEEEKEYFLTVVGSRYHYEDKWCHDGFMEFENSMDGVFFPVEDTPFHQKWEKSEKVDKVLGTMFEEIELFEKAKLQYEYEEKKFLEKKEKEMLEILKEGSKVEAEFNYKGIRYKIYQDGKEVRTIIDYGNNFEM